jgi:general stress protein 26
MNSIHANQPEDHRDDLVASDAVAKLKELVHDGQNGFFRTTTASHGTSVRPMNVRQVDDAGNLWFLSAIDSFKNDELEENAEVELFFQGEKHSDFLHLNGLATISRDRRKIDELWEPTIKTWFTEGKDDPRISVIKVEPSDGYYWDTRHGSAVAGIKMLIGAATGRTMDDSVEGEMTM